MTLKLKKTFANYKHFIMESINNVINLIKPDVYMTSINLKEAFIKSILNLFGNLF